MTRSELIQFVEANIYPNGRNQITAPMVRDSILATIDFMGDAAVCDIGLVAQGNLGLVTGASVYSAINTAIASAIKFQGVTSTALTDGSTTNPILIDGESYTAKKGDVVLYGGKEFLWTGSAWEELGDEASWALKTITISAGTGLVGGGDLSANRTISLSQDSIDKLALANTAYQKPSSGIPLTDLASGVQTSLGLADTVAGYFTSGILGSTHLPSMYIGTTGVQFSSAAQALTGITNLTMTGKLTIGDAEIEWVAGTGGAPGYLKINQAILTTGDQIIGSGTPGGGGGGGASYLYELNDVYSNGTKTAVLRANNDPKVGGDVLTYDSSLDKWVAAPSQSPLTAGTGITISNNVISVTANTYAPYNSAGYLPLSAGSSYPLTGDLYVTPSVSSIPLRLKSSNINDVWIELQNNSSVITYLGYTATNGLTYQQDATNYKVYHSGNSNKLTVGWSASSIYLPNATGMIYFRNAADTAWWPGMFLSASNNLIIGNYVAQSSKDTVIDGYNVRLRYGQSNTDGIYLNSSGKVGIGTSSPSCILSVLGSSSWTGQFLSSNTEVCLAHNDGYGLSVCSKTSSSSYYLMSVKYNQTTLGTGGNTALYVRGDGNVGIGTSSPTSKLDILSSSTTATYTAKIKNSAAHNGVCLETVWPYNPFIDFVGDGTVRAQIGYTYNGNRLYISKDSTTGGIFYVDFTNSRIGIGTTSPSEKFEVSTTAGWAIAGVGGSAAVWAAHNLGYGLAIASKTTSSSYYLLNVSYGQSTLGSGGTVALQVRGDGNVGIGTSSPGYKLDVNGTARFTMTSASDFVLYRNQDTGGAFITYYSSQQTTNYWLAGGDSSANDYQFSFLYNSTRVARISSTGDLCLNGSLLVNITPSGSLLTSSNYGFQITTNSSRVLLYAFAPSTASAASDIRMTTTGVGIGTLPSYKLHVNGSSGWTGGFTSTNTEVVAAHNSGYGLSVSSKTSSSSYYLLNVSYNQTTLGSGGSTAFYVRGDGKVGIGTNSPACALDVSGEVSASTKLTSRAWYINTNTYISRGSLITGGLTADDIGIWANDGTNKRIVRVWCSDFNIQGPLSSTGDQTISSDIVWKTNLQPVKYTINDIAKCRAVTFDWKDGRGKSAGSIAQDWKPLIPELVHGEEGNMTLAYGQIALINSILLAKHETEQDKEINRLKKRVKELENEVKRLRS